LLQKEVKRSDSGKKSEFAENKEEIIRKVLFQKNSKSFLEIGIGQFPNLERIKLIAKNKIKYTGLDFKSVCENHKQELELKGLKSPNIRYLSNEVGTYSWTLFKILKKKQKFDLIYLDGHHTFYIDLPAFILAHFLLKPSGYLLIDDVNWTLEFLRKNLSKNYLDWYFYHKMYNFSEYDENQQKIPHMKMIIKNLLIPKLKYSEIKKFRTVDFMVFKKKDYL